MSAQPCQLKWEYSLHREKFAELPAVMDVMGHDSPYDPLKRDLISLALIGVPKSLHQVVGGPVRQDSVNHSEGLFQPVGEFWATSAQPNRRSKLLSIGRTDPAKPIDAAIGDVLCKFGDGSRVWMATKRKLLFGKVLHRKNKTALVAIPASVHRF